MLNTPTGLNMAQNAIQPFPLDRETRVAIPTKEAAAHLGRSAQTLRIWACLETFPTGLRPIRCNGRLLWPVAGIKAQLGMAQ